VEAEGSANARGTQGRCGPSDETFAVPQPAIDGSQIPQRVTNMVGVDAALYRSGQPPAEWPAPLAVPSGQGRPLQIGA